MTASGVTCAWCFRTVAFGERHGEGVCTVSVPFDTARIDAMFTDTGRSQARRFEAELLAATPPAVARLSADTPLVSRSPHVPGRSTAYVLDGSMFADDRLRVVLAESTSAEVFDAVQAELEERARREHEWSSVSRVFELIAERMPCSYCRTVGGHAPTCITEVEAQLSVLTNYEKEL